MIEQLDGRHITRPFARDQMDVVRNTVRAPKPRTKGAAASRRCPVPRAIHAPWRQTMFRPVHIYLRDTPTFHLFLAHASLQNKVARFRWEHCSNDIDCPRGDRVQHVSQTTLHKSHASSTEICPHPVGGGTGMLVVTGRSAVVPPIVLAFENRSRCRGMNRHR